MFDDAVLDGHAELGGECRGEARDRSGGTGHDRAGHGAGLVVHAVVVERAAHVGRDTAHAVEQDTARLVDDLGVALELLDSGAWSGQGVLGPEALPPQPFLDLLTEYGSPWACEERTPTRT